MAVCCSHNEKHIVVLRHISHFNNYFTRKFYKKNEFSGNSIYLIESGALGEDLAERHLSEEIKENGIDVRFMYDYLSNDDKRKIDNEVKELVICLKNFLQSLCGVSISLKDLPDILTYPLNIETCTFVEKVYTIKKVVDSEQPVIIHIITSDLSNIWRELSKEKGIRVFSPYSLEKFTEYCNDLVREKRRQISTLVMKLFILFCSLTGTMNKWDKALKSDKTVSLLHHNKADYNYILKHLKKLSFKMFYYDNLNIKNIINLILRRGLESNLLSLMTYRDFSQANKINKILLEEIKRNNNKLNGVNIFDLNLTKVCIDILIKCVKDQLLVVLVHSCCLSKLIQEYNLRLLMIPNDITSREKSMTLTCQKEGIPVFVIQHGFPVHPVGFIPVTANKICVWGPRIKEWFMNLGTDESKILITGSLLSDYIYYRQCGINLQDIKNNVSKQILFASSPNVKYSAFSNDRADVKILKWLSKCTEMGKNIEVTVKLHPSENLKKFKTFIEQDNNKISFVNNHDLYDMIEECDIFVTIASTTACDAVLMNKPVILVDAEFENLHLPFAQENVAYYVTTEQEFLNCLDHILSNQLIQNSEQRTKYIRNYHISHDGRSGERIANSIAETINEKIK